VRDFDLPGTGTDDLYLECVVCLENMPGSFGLEGDVAMS
jgi:hypothetical protein